MPRRLLRTEDRGEDRLESINGNSILLGTNFHQVGPDVWREMIEKEAFEEKTFILVNPVGQGQQGAHLPRQFGGLLVSGQGKGHKFLIPLERVEGV